MSGSLKFRLFIIVFVVAAALAAAWPPFDRTLDDGTKVEGKINLGLDLQGGMHLVLEVQAEEAVWTEVKLLASSLEERLAEAGVTGAKAVADQERIRLTLADPGQIDKAREVIDEDFPSLSEDLLGGGDGALHLSLDSKRAAQIRYEAVLQTEETIRKRVDELGVSEPIIQREGSGGRILVQLPGIEDPDRALSVIGRVARLEFRLVVDSGPDREALERQYADKLGSDYEILEQAPPKGAKPDTPPARYYVVHREAPITGNDLETARLGQDEIGLPAVDFILTREGGRRIREFSQKHLQEQLAIVLENKVESAPVIQGTLGSRSQITGRFSMQEAQDLALVLRAGALPASVKILEQRSVGPSLGRDSIEQGIRSIIIGGLLVVVVMLVVYKGSGIIANIALIVNLILVAGALAAVGATLTLPGIAGIILTIGMAVDANILVLERIKEELRLGKTVRTAVRTGFDRAFWTIMDANVTTLLAGFVLLQFGTGPIKGFAVTLCIGILSTLFAALVVSRTIYDLILARWNLSSLSI